MIWATIDSPKAANNKKIMSPKTRPQIKGKASLKPDASALAIVANIPGPGVAARIIIASVNPITEYIVNFFPYLDCFHVICSILILTSNVFGVLNCLLLPCTLQKHLPCFSWPVNIFHLHKCDIGYKLWYLCFSSCFFLLYLIFLKGMIWNAAYPIADITLFFSFFTSLNVQSPNISFRTKK